MKYLLLSIFTSMLLMPGTGESYLLVGTYTGKGSEGIYVYRSNSRNGSYSEAGLAVTENPSYLAVSPDGRFVFAANEKGKDDNGGEVTAFNFDNRQGSLKKINTQPSGGDHPCYVEVDKTGRWLIVGNYSSGTLSVLPIALDGSLGVAVQTIRHEGKSINASRQDKPHVHCTKLSPDNKWLMVPDLGIDRVMIYAFDEVNGHLSPAAQPYAATEPGSGPRHFVFHPGGAFAYLIEEMSGTVSAFTYNDGSLKPIQRISILPEGYDGAIGAADIHISGDGRYLYASNRGDANDISIFAVKEDGTLAWVDRQALTGKTPRNFNFDPSGEFLLVANQGSDEVVVFKRDKETGKLAPTRVRISVSRPVCIKWIAAR